MLSPDEAKLDQQISICDERAILVGSRNLHIWSSYQAPPASSAHGPYLLSLLGYGAY